MNYGGDGYGGYSGGGYSGGGYSGGYSGGSGQPYFPHPQRSRSDVQNLMSYPAPGSTIHYRLRDCFMRFQQPQRGQSPESAMVTNPVWDQTATAVTDTINNYANYGGTNIQLWLQGDVSGMLYAGLYTSNHIRMQSQPGLSQDDVVVSIILPSGVAKLYSVSGIESDIPGGYREAAGVVFGIALRNPHNPLTPEDYVYTNSKHLKRAIRNWTPDSRAYGISVPRGHDTIVLEMDTPI
jgi:hypothetical protein